MARREANDQRILSQYWGTQTLTHRQCLVNILTRLTVGDVDLGAIGLPPHPGRENFTWKSLSKRSDSNPTYHVTYKDQSREVHFVVRMRPLQSKYEHLHRVCREQEVMVALQKLGLPVPRVYHVEPCPEYVGTEFFIMEYVEGRTIHDYSMKDLKPWQRTQVLRSVAENLAKLHSLPITESLELLLDENQRCSTIQKAWLKQIATWKRNLGVHAYSNADIKHLITRLEQMQVPSSRNRSILHYDFNFDNLKFDPQTFKLKAILDWEMCTIGDPLSDLANVCMIYTKIPKSALREYPCLSQMFVDPTTEGVLTEKEFLALYRQHRPAPIPEHELEYAKVVTCLRFISVFQNGLDDDDKHEREHLDRGKAVEFLIHMGSDLLRSKY